VQVQKEVALWGAVLLLVLLLVAAHCAVLSAEKSPLSDAAVQFLFLKLE
jgi:hypothetical protein